MARRYRTNRYSQLGGYEYYADQPISVDFGAIGDKFLEGQKYIEERRQFEIAKLEQKDKDLREASDFPLSGNADVDKAGMIVGEGIRNDLHNARKRIGLSPEDGGLTRAEYREIYNNTMNSAKAYKGISQFAKNEFERIEKDDSLSDIVGDLYNQSIGAVYDADRNYGIRTENGNIILMTQDEQGKKHDTDLKKLLVNKAQDVKKFDVFGSVSDIKKLYMGQNKTLQGLNPGEKFSVVDIEGNPALFTSHVVGQGKAFGQFLDTYLDAFENSDRVVSFMYDHQGVKLGGKDGIQFKNGRIALTKDQRKKAREDYKKYIQGQIGVQEVGKYQFIPQGNRSSSSTKDTVVVYGNMTGTNPKTLNQPLGLQDILSANVAGEYVKLPMDDRPAALGLMKAYELSTDAAKGEINNSYKTFKTFNPDLYDTKGKFKIEATRDSNGEYSYINEDFDREGGKSDKLEFESFSIGANLGSGAMDSINSTSSSGQALKNISGIVFSKQRFKPVNKDEKPVFNADGKVDLDTTGVDIIGFRLAGNVVYQEKGTESGFIAPKKGETQEKGYDQREQELKGTGFTNTLTGSDATSVLRQLSTDNPAITLAIEAFKKRNPGISPIKTLYHIVKQLSN